MADAAWQYHVIPWGPGSRWGSIGGDSGLSEMLNAKGAEGWELVASVDVFNAPERSFVFKRPAAA